MASTILNELSTYRCGFYQELKEISRREPCKARLLSVPLAVVDRLVLVLAAPFVVVEQVAHSAIHLLGALFGLEGYTIKSSIMHLERGLSELVKIPVQVVMAPLKILYQVILPGYEIAI